VQHSRLLPITLTLLFAASASGAEVNHSWEQLLATIQSGRKIIVTRMSSANLEARLISIGDQSITVQQSDGPRVIPRNEVFRVRYAPARPRNAALGALIGGAGGALVFTVCESERKAEAAAMGAIFGLIGGAITGGALRSGPPLYEALEVRRPSR